MPKGTRKNDEGFAETLETPPGAVSAAPARSPSRDETPPPVLLGDRYRIVGRIGAGGFGVVYEATDTRLQKRVAVKVLSEQHCQDEHLVERFRAEALAAGRLDHPGIVAVTDFELGERGRPFLVMEYVEGEPLDKLLLRERPLQPQRAATIARALCRALAVAHGAGIVHRDLKPANIVMQPRSDGTEAPKVLDFGVAKLVERSDTQPLTNTGHMVGTPLYMSPEQIRNRELDGRSDIYSVGVILYELITGITPFSGRSTGDVMVSKVVDKPVAPSDYVPDLAAGLEGVVMRAIDRDPAKRFESSDEMAAALEPFALPGHSTQERAAPKSRPRPWLAIAAALFGAALAVAVVAWVWGGEERGEGEGVEVVVGEPQDSASKPPSTASASDSTSKSDSASDSTSKSDSASDSDPASASASASDPEPEPEPEAAAKDDATDKPRRKKRSDPGRGGLFDSPRDRLRIPR